METIKTGLLLAMLLIFPFSLRAQVTIGSDLPPEKAAILDVKTMIGGEGGVSSQAGGILLPRIEIDTVTNLSVFPGLSGIDNDEQKKKHKGLVVYNINTDHEQNVEEGIYVWSGVRWEKSTFRERINFFYMPSIMIPTNTAGTQTPIDLYAKYKEQFGTPLVKSTGAPAAIPFYLNRSELYYYITDFDKTVFDEANISINADGILNYKVLNESVDGSSYINIVFVVK